MTSARSDGEGESAEGGDRTHTALTGHGILSPECLPVPPPRHLQAPPAARGGTPRSIESGEAPAWQGATREHIGHIRPRSNAVQAGCIAARMQRGFRHGLPDDATAEMVPLQSGDRHRATNPGRQHPPRRVREGAGTPALGAVQVRAGSTPPPRQAVTHQASNPAAAALRSVRPGAAPHVGEHAGDGGGEGVDVPVERARHDGPARDLDGDRHAAVDRVTIQLKPRSATERSSASGFCTSSNAPSVNSRTRRTSSSAHAVGSGPLKSTSVSTMSSLPLSRTSTLKIIASSSQAARRAEPAR